MIAARYLSLGVPLALAGLAGAFDRQRSARAGALLAFIAAAVGVAAVNEVAARDGDAGWYRFAAVDGRFRGMPVDLWIGWAALWGPVPVLARRLVPLPLALGLLLWLDTLTMPALQVLVQLGPRWLTGELVGLVGVALPAQMLGRWTADRTHLVGRVVLQLAVFSAALLWLVPTAAFEFGDGAWSHLQPAWMFPLGQLAFLIALPGLSAVAEFAGRGGGTPFPWDPPRRLVTTGPYAYVANPMQISATGLLLLTALAAGSAWLGLAGLTAAAFALGVAAPHEREDLRRRYGEDWRAYRRHVRAWWPRWRPYRSGPGALWLDEGCGPCRTVGHVIGRRKPVALTLAAAGPGMIRAGYDDGHGERGVAAVARGLEHVNLGWAYLGWLLRLPGVVWLAQIVVDALIAPPRVRGVGCRIPSSACSTAPSPPSASTASPASPPARSRPPPA